MKNAASAELQGILQPTQQAEIPQELGDSARVGRFWGQELQLRTQHAPDLRQTYKWWHKDTTRRAFSLFIEQRC